MALPWERFSGHEAGSGCTQAEKERQRILQRLKEGRQARTGPHQPRWFTFHPEVTASPRASMMHLCMPRTLLHG